LKGLKDRYEAHHRVRYTDEALEASVEYSTRYITGRFLPDKAIDVMDEAGARVRLTAMTQPPDLKELDADITRLDREKEDSVANQDFERAAQLRDQAYRLRKQKEKLQEEWREKSRTQDLVVDMELIAETVSKMTGVPLQRLDQGEAERLLKMEDVLHESVVSQDEAISAIAKAVRRSRSGLKDPRRPMGSFIFLGPTGVGKTHLAKQLAKFMFGTEEALIQIDMSEYMENFNASKLVGAPPGYVGYEEGGQLTEKVRRRPYSVVLLDEVEKAHPDIFNMLLQIMEEGRLTDSFGRQIDFRNVILIMTSNIGAAVLKNQAGLGFNSSEPGSAEVKLESRLKSEVERFFRPEFLNRVDDLIYFKSLTRDDIKVIVDIQLKDLYARLASKNMRLVLTDDAKNFLHGKGYSDEYGARPMRRAIERYLEDPLSEEILRGTLKEGYLIEVDVGPDGLGFVKRPLPAEEIRPAEQKSTS
ncbi:MAG TPA: ATP-dependent Clp protease ATP-binding subunit, partial [Planctomycetota bacterium]|nr:ATP-dependent Clp protease ATP-binding subunit [Planctomycetota bacterium]